MERQIKLDYLINFLVDKKFTKNIKTNRKKSNEKSQLDYLEYYNSSNFSNFKDILSNNVDRVGIRKENYLNNSVYFSTAFILFKNFNIMEENDQNYILKEIKRKIKDDFMSKNFKIKLNLKMLKDILNKDINSYEDVYILALYFKVNIYVFNNATNKIITFFEDEKLNIYKPNIFLNQIGEIFFPLVYKMNNGNLFKYNSTILNKLIFSDNIFPYKQKEFIISNDWNEILKDYSDIDTSNIIVDLDIKNSINLEDSDSENSFNIDDLDVELDQFNNDGYNTDNSMESLKCINIEIEDVNKLNIKYDVENLGKYKKNELFDLIKDNNLDCKVNKKSLKSEIIEEIKSKLC